MKDLMIPENLSLEKEVVSGIQQRDIKKLIAIAVPGSTIGIIVWLSASDPMVQFIAMLATLGYLALCYAVVARIEGTPSILNYIELLIRFQREQQRFYYKQGKEKLYHVAAQSANGYPEADGTGIYQR